MKVAISLPDPVFNAAEQLAHQLKVSRSQHRRRLIPGLTCVVPCWSFSPIRSIESRIATIIVAAVTSNLALAEAPGNIRVGKSDSGLSKPAVVNVSQMLTIDRSFLTARVRALPGQAMRQVEEGLRLVLGL